MLGSDENGSQLDMSTGSVSEVGLSFVVDSTGVGVSFVAGRAIGAISIPGTLQIDLYRLVLKCTYLPSYYS